MGPKNESEFQMTVSDGMLNPEITATKVISVVVFLVTSVFGLVMNTLYIWVLRFRMTQSVNTTWFFHLIITNFLFTLDMPLIAAYVLRNPLWIFGNLICKLNNTLMNTCLLAGAFFLTAIGLERFFLVYYPIWYRKHMNLRWASVICLSLWGLAILSSFPYLILCHVEEKGNITVCCSEFIVSWKDGDPQKIDRTTAWGIFGFLFCLGFVLPLGLLSICYLLIGLKIRRENLARSLKPYKLILLVVIFFFICWAPYHLRNGMLVEKGRFPDVILQVLIVLATCFMCVNSCFTPILYLFIVDSFNKEFRKAVQLLLNCPFTWREYLLERHN